MHFSIPTTLALLLLITPSLTASKPRNAILLSSIQSLTLHANKPTAHRRVPAVPQLKCIGGAGCKHYEVPTMRCTNTGSSYSSEDIEWTCVASLPEEFKLGSTDVICEGYDSSDDEYVLKGSCGVEYRLLLTDKGEEKYGKGGWFDSPSKHEGADWPGVLFMLIFVGVLGWIIYSVCMARQRNARLGPDGRPVGGGGWGGFGGGGGGGGGNDPFDDPPPPYTPGGGKRWSYTRANPGPARGEAWRPGFWSGALGGAAAGYLAGNRGGRQEVPQQRTGGLFGGGGWGGNTGGYGTQGPSYSGGRSTSSSSSSGSSPRYESTGFGSTSRR